MKGIARFAALGILIGSGLSASVMPARAGIDVSFGANVPLGDDGRLFVNISSRYFERDPSVIDVWGRRFPDPDDVAVFFWIAERSRKNADFVFSLRRQGLGWFEIGTRCGIPVDAWYVPVATPKPGPPYGKAYGYWKKHQRSPGYRMRVNDRQARDLVAMRMAHEYYRVSPEVAMDWRRSGDDVRVIMTREYRTRRAKNGKTTSESASRERGEGHGNGHGKGKGDRHGNGGSKH